MPRGPMNRRPTPDRTSLVSCGRAAAMRFRREAANLRLRRSSRSTRSTVGGWALNSDITPLRETGLTMNSCAVGRARVERHTRRARLELPQRVDEAARPDRVSPACSRVAPVERPPSRSRVRPPRADGSQSALAGRGLGDEPGQQRRPPGQGVHLDVLVERVRPGANSTQPVEGRHTERRGEITV